MARILICHVPKDGSIAREVGSALMGRGHFVSFDGEPDQARDDRSARMRQFEAVIVVWTEGSSQSAGLADIAQEAMPLNLLVPVRAEEVPLTRLPLTFRKLSMIAPRDIDGLARVVARLSAAASSLREMAESESARRAAESSQQRAARKAAPPPMTTEAFQFKPGRHIQQGQTPLAPPSLPPAPPVVERQAASHARLLVGLPEAEEETNRIAREHRPDRSMLDVTRDARRPGTPKERASAPMVTAVDLGRAVDDGLLVQHIPATMWLGEASTVEFSLGSEFLSGLSAPTVDFGHGEDRQAIETLSISLYGEADAFDVDRQSERTQFVTRKLAVSTRDPEMFGRWTWTVVPCAVGAQALVVRISALLRDRHGVPAPMALPDRRYFVTVEVPESVSFVSSLAGWYRR